MEAHPNVAPNQERWKVKSDPVTIDSVEFRSTSGRKVEHDQRLHAQLTAMISRHYTGERQQVDIDAREIQKPEWFQSAESTARTFMATLGFAELGTIYLLEDYIDDVMDEQNVDAYHDSITRDIIVSEPKMIHILKTDGINVATSVLVHELAHDTALKPSQIVLQQHADNSTHWAQRNGWIVSGAHGDQGSFIEEGFCEYVASLFRRQCTYINAERAPLLPHNYAPSIDLPQHLRTSAVLAGHDAHAIELMAWGIEQRGMMLADTFISKLFETRKAATSTQSMREIIAAINELSPGLYSYLKNVERSPEAWSAARDAVYDVVTRQ